MNELTKKHNVIHPHSVLLFSLQMDGNIAMYYNMMNLESTMLRQAVTKYKHRMTLPMRYLTYLNSQKQKVGCWLIVARIKEKGR